MRNITDQQVENAYKSAPAAVRSLLDSEEAIPNVVSGLGTTFKLHINVVGEMAALTRNLLLGLIQPAEFLSTVAEANVPETTARQIMSEINEKLFKPLHEEMRKANARAQPPAAKPPAPVAAVSEPPQVGIPNLISRPPQAPTSATRPSIPTLSPRPPFAPTSSERASASSGPVATLPPRGALPRPAFPASAPQASTGFPKSSAPAPTPANDPHAADPYREPLL